MTRVLLRQPFSFKHVPEMSPTAGAHDLGAGAVGVAVALHRSLDPHPESNLSCDL
jgi:hypothetical protein